MSVKRDLMDTLHELPVLLGELGYPESAKAAAAAFARVKDLDMENTRLRAIGQVLENRLTLVKAMHRAEDWPSRNPVCGCCGEVWPCPTYRATEGKP